MARYAMRTNLQSNIRVTAMPGDKPLLGQYSAECQLFSASRVSKEPALMLVVTYHAVQNI